MLTDTYENKATATEAIVELCDRIGRAEASGGQDEAKRLRKELKSQLETVDAREADRLIEEAAERARRRLGVERALEALGSEQALVESRWQALGERMLTMLAELHAVWQEHEAVHAENERLSGEVTALRNRIRHYGYDVPSPEPVSMCRSLGVSSGALHEMRALARRVEKGRHTFREVPAVQVPRFPRRWDPETNRAAIREMNEREDRGRRPKGA